MIENLLEDLIKEFAQKFQQQQIDNCAGAAATNADDTICDIFELRVYAKFWKKDILKALHAHDNELVPLSCENLANWFLRYSYALCNEPRSEFYQRGCLKICNTLQYFPPREKLLNVIIAAATSAHARVQTLTKVAHAQITKLCATIFVAPTNVTNFVEHLQFLLEIEDLENINDYLPLVQRGVILKRCGGFNFRGTLNAPQQHNELQMPTKIDEVVIITARTVQKNQFDINSPADCINALMPHQSNSTAFINKLPVAQIQEIQTNQILLEWNFRSQRDFQSPVDLIFRSTRYPIRYQQRCLSLLANNASMRQFLFPKSVAADGEVGDVAGDVAGESVCSSIASTDELTAQQLINKTIAANPEQFAAVQRIASKNLITHAPYIIYGPPGTGKTTTIVEAIIQLRLRQPQSRILVTASSNSACDTIALRLAMHFECKELQERYLELAEVLPMLRIYSRTILDSGGLKQQDSTHLLLLQRYSNIAWLNGEHAYPAVENIHQFGIVIATLSSVGKLVNANVNKTTSNGEGFFTHVFIDEAGASSEPEALVGIIGIKQQQHDHCHIILAGDHKQLGPIVKSAQALKFGLAKSLLQRLLESDCYKINDVGEYDRSLQLRLRRNYRSHPAIVELYNRLYYNQELIAMVKSAGELGDDVDDGAGKFPFLKNPKFPILFHAICGEMCQQATTSAANMQEVQLVLDYIKMLMANQHQRRHQRHQQQDIGVITPYKLQIKCIKNALIKSNWPDIEVGSVEYFQGREKSIIIASMVRSKNGLGFVKNRQRLNVLLSRPQKLLIIIGEPLTLSSFQDFKFIIDQCKRHDNYFVGALSTKKQQKAKKMPLKTKNKAKISKRNDKNKNQRKAKVEIEAPSTIGETANVTGEHVEHAEHAADEQNQQLNRKTKAKKSTNRKFVERIVKIKPSMDKASKICASTTKTESTTLTNATINTTKPAKTKPKLAAAICAVGECIVAGIDEGIDATIVPANIAANGTDVGAGDNDDFISKFSSQT